MLVINGYHILLLHICPCTVYLWLLSGLYTSILEHGKDDDMASIMLPSKWIVSLKALRKTILEAERPLSLHSNVFNWHISGFWTSRFYTW